MSSRRGWLHNNRVRTVLICAFFLCVACCLAALVAVSLQTLTQTADQLDDRRDIHAAEEAQNSLRKQLAGTVRDNAYWDDAVQHVSARDAAWVIDMWGTTSKDYPLYDTALVIDPAGKPLIAYQQGQPLAIDVFSYFDTSLQALLTQARAQKKADKLPVSFIGVQDGVAVIGAARIQPAGAVEGDSGYILVFAKHLTADVLTDLSASSGLKSLQLDGPRTADRLTLPVNDASGRQIGVMSWISETPGTDSFHSVIPLVAAAGAAFLVLLASIIFTGMKVVQGSKREEAKSRYRAVHDPLTGLVNRPGLSEAYGEMRDISGPHRYCLHLIDLDGFKSINDLWGHQVGDALIVAVADRIAASVPADAVIARLGGDEFVVLERCPVSRPDWTMTGDVILRELTKPFDLRGRVVEVGCSIGQAESCDESDIYELLRKADIALYKAKDAGRGRIVCFQEIFDIEQAEDASLERELKACLDNDALDVMFQPLVDARSRNLVGVEALARWRTPGRGYISPEIFIPLAERAGLIETLGLQMLRKALLGASQWPGIALSVNASPIELRNPFFVGHVKALLAETGFDPARLTIEITEGVLITNPDQAARAITGLKALGLKIALDDFGTGYASIGTLRTFHFDRLKIDRSLVSALHDGISGAKILQATIALADALNIPVTAEGVEQEEQAIALHLSGCDLLQGYLFSKPVPADVITAELATTRMTSEVVEHSRRA